MANRAFLCMADTDDATHGDEFIGDDTIIAGASWALPVLWCSVFSVNDIRNVSAPREEYGDEGEYEEAEAGEALIPRFVTSTKTATRRARERKPRFLEVFPSECEHIYEEWVALLEGIDAPYLHLLTDELWAMDPEDFAVKLRAWLQAFEQNRADDWAALLQQVDIAFDPVTGRASLMEGETAREIGVALRGYRWLRPVPWSEE